MTSSPLSAPPPSTPSQPAPTMGSFARIVGVFFSPKPTFESIAQRPSWILPLLVLLVMSLAVIAIFGQRVGWRSYMERQDATNSRAQKQMEQMTADQRERMIEQQTKFAPVVTYVVVVIVTFVAPLLAAAVLMVAFNLMAGSKVGFSQSFGIVAHSWMPYLISGLLGILILFIKDPSTIDLDHLVASNPGALLSDGSAKWLVSLLTSLDLFTFWALILQAIGFSATNPKKLSVGKAFGTIFAVWLLYVFVKVGLAAAFS